MHDVPVMSGHLRPSLVPGIIAQLRVSGVEYLSHPPTPIMGVNKVKRGKLKKSLDCLCYFEFWLPQQRSIETRNQPAHLGPFRVCETRLLSVGRCTMSR